MKKNIILFILAFVLVIFETVISRYIGIRGVYPEVVFAFVMCVAVLDNDLTRVTVLSTICGLVLDCLNGGTVGVNLFAFGVSAVLCNFITEKFFMPNVIILIISILFCSTVSRFLIFALGFAVFGNVDLRQVFVPLIMNYVLYNTVIGVVLYIIVKKTVYSAKTNDRR